MKTVKTSNLLGVELDYAVAMADGWIFTGSNDHTKPSHNASLDFPGKTYDDWDSKGAHPRLEKNGEKFYFCTCDSTCFLPMVSEDWSYAGEIIEREIINIKAHYDGWTHKVLFWEANISTRTAFCSQLGDTPLIAAMRCFVHSKLGETTKVPE